MYRDLLFGVHGQAASPTALSRPWEAVDALARAMQLMTVSLALALLLALAVALPLVLAARRWRAHPATAHLAAAMPGGQAIPARPWILAGLADRSMPVAGPGADERGSRGGPCAAGSAPAPAPHTRLIEACSAALERRDVIGGEVALLLVDLAQPERVLTALGGGSLLDVARQTMRRLRAWLPAQDSVVQLGATTFAVLTEGLGHEGAQRQVNRLTGLLSEPMHSGQHTAPVAFAIGVALSCDDLNSGPALLAAAQEARRHAAAFTADGVSAWRRYDRSVHADAIARGALEAELRQALRHQRIQAAFQPVLALAQQAAEDRIIAMQALPRWTRTDGSDVAADTLLAVAQEANLATAVWLQVLDCGLDAVSAWYAAGFPVGRLAVRVGSSVLEDADLLGCITTRLARRDLPMTCLLLEVDPACVCDGAGVRPVLARLRDQGAEVILAGVAAPQVVAGLLRSLPLSGISLHRTVTEAMVEHPVPAATALAACRRAGLRCLAEGVGDLEQLHAARQIGIDAVSGPLIGRPARARDVAARFGQKALHGVG